MKLNLKPCPHCGKSDNVIYCDGVVGCTDCEADATSVESWNNRVMPSELQKLMAWLRYDVACIDKCPDRTNIEKIMADVEKLFTKD